MIMNCFLCGSSTVRRKFLVKHTFSYYRCMACGAYALERIPDDLSVYYGKGYFTGDIALDGYVDYEAEKRQSIHTFEKYLDIIAKVAPDAKTLFEVGCATGFFLNLARARGFDVEGSDVSEYGVEEAKKKGLCVYKRTLQEQAKTGNNYDVVVLLDTLEHLIDPIGDIRAIHTLLNPGGFVAFTSPDAGSMWARVWGKRWHAFVPPQHIHLFSLNNITTVLNKQGFDLISAEHYGKSFSLSYIFRLLKTWTGLTFLGHLSHFCNENPLLKKITIPLNVGDTMFVIAKKV